jgi:hypothetical protein
MRARLRRSPALLLASICLISIELIGSEASAQAASAVIKSSQVTKGGTTAKSATNLDWLTLTPLQHQALLPLASSWRTLSDPQKKKWIALSANYQTLPAPAKEKLHERMVQWAALTPKQRAQARLNYSQTQRVSVEDKAERWEVYQALTAEQKQTLAASAPKLPLAPHVKLPKAPSQ